jgi:two-component system KDP operon response regulator KdpE
MQTGNAPSAMDRSTIVDALVLLVGGDPNLGSALASTLVGHGFRAHRAGTSEGMLAQGMLREADLLLLDVTEHEDGAALAARWRARTSAAIVVLLEQSAEQRSGDVLDAGADDYLVKPFAMAELLGRTRVWLRERARARVDGPAQDIRAPDRIRIRIVGDGRSLLVDGREVHVTPLERKLLLILARSPGCATSEEQLMMALWGPGSPTRVQHLRAHVRQLRLKIEMDPARPRHLLSESGGGYRLNLR